MKSTGFKWNPDETIIRAQAKALKDSGLQSKGYTYVNLDAGWSLRERDNKTGRPQPNPALYPNIANGKLAADLESQGFKFGIYSDSGTLHCGGGGPGGLGHEPVDAQAYADWGVSFLKYDNCFVPPSIYANPIPRYTAMSKALNATGRPIFFAMCEWGDADPATWGPAVSNSWRTTADISDEWWAMCEVSQSGRHRGRILLLASQATARPAPPSYGTGAASVATTPVGAIATDTANVPNTANTANSANTAAATAASCRTSPQSGSTALVRARGTTRICWRSGTAA